MASTSLALLERRLPCHIVAEVVIGGALPSPGRTRCGVVKATSTRVLGTARGDCHPCSFSSLLGPGVCERCGRILISRPDHFDICTCCFRGLCPDCGATCELCFGSYCHGFCQCGCQIDLLPVEAQQSAAPMTYVAAPVEAHHHAVPVEAHHQAVPPTDVGHDPRDPLTYPAAPVTFAAAPGISAVVDDPTAMGPTADAAVDVSGPTEYAERQYAYMSPDERKERVRRTRADNARDLLGDIGATLVGGADRDAVGGEEARYEEVSNAMKGKEDKVGLKEDVGVSTAGEIALACPCGVFRSRGKATGSCVLDPELLKRVAAKAGQDSAILKETRKAAEEATLSRKGKKDV